jgi:hypothetical protein
MPRCFSRTRGRITAIRGGRGGVILSSSRPAPYVPEELISQAQSVLQVSLTQDPDPDPDPRIRSAPYVPEELISQAQSVLQVRLIFIAQSTVCFWAIRIRNYLYGSGSFH